MKTEKVMQHLIGKTYKEVVSNLTYYSYDGDCCGWSDVEVSDLVTDDSAILVDAVKISYEMEEGDRVVVNFVFDLGDQKGLILGYDLSAGSGSGWAYGAHCSLSYQDECIAVASY